MTDRTLSPGALDGADRSVQDEAWRTAAGASSAILACTVAIGALTFLGAGEHLPLRVRFDSIAGAGTLVLLVAVPAFLFGLWPADTATRRLPRAARLAIFALGGAFAGAVAGAAIGSVKGAPLDGALLGAAIGLLGGLAGFLGLTWLSRSRTAVSVTVLVTLVVIVYGTWRLQTF